MFKRQDLEQVSGSDLYGSDERKIGTAGAVYADDHCPTSTDGANGTAGQPIEAEGDVSDCR